MDEVFKALADARRRRLLDRFNERNGQTRRELYARLAMARLSVSKHLALWRPPIWLALGREKPVEAPGGEPGHPNTR
jgi:DNA-binding transcriptional ArsR family regulator